MLRLFTTFTSKAHPRRRIPHILNTFIGILGGIAALEGTGQ